MKKAENTAIHMRIIGRVQGVFFRNEMQEFAASHNVRGWVKNEDDGSVSAFAQGLPDDIHAVIEWVKKGSRLSSIHHVEWERAPVDSLLTDFSIH